jgi:hypothetical protein
MAAEVPDEPRTDVRRESLWRRIPRIVKAAAAAVIAAGGVAAALKQLGLGPQASAKQAVTLRVTGVQAMPLSEFKLRRRNGTLHAAVAMRRVSARVVLAQATDTSEATATATAAATATATATETATATATGTSTATPTATETGTATSTATATAEPTCDARPSDPAHPALPSACAVLSSTATQRLPVVPTPPLPDNLQTTLARLSGVDFTCVAPQPDQVTCTPDPTGFPEDAAAYPDNATGRRQAVAAAGRMLHDVRTRAVGGHRQPWGILVRYRFLLKGYEGDRVAIGWSLWNASGRPRLPRDWMFTRRAVLIEADRSPDFGDDGVWIPLPRVKGPFFASLTVFDSKGVDLREVRTKRFR